MCLDLMSISSLKVAHMSTADEIGEGLDLLKRRPSTLHHLAEEMISREKTTVVSLKEISHLREITLAFRTIERLIEPDVSKLPFH